MDTSQMDIPKFYSERSLFITGATGFMGKVLLEKILRCCPDVSTIYVLIRPKKGLTPQARLKVLLQSPLFAMILDQRPDCKSQITPVEGDTLRPNLGLKNDSITEISEKVSIVFHCAASVKFQEPFKDALDSNVRGIEGVLGIVKNMKKFEALVHLSTAYAYCYRKHIDEVIYPTNVSATDLLNCASWMSQEMLERIGPDLQGDHPNTYTYTKSLAENLLQNLAPKSQTVIVRPSIVTAAWKEPMPGWCDSINGPVGLVITFGKGLLRTMLGKRSSVANFIPVDVAINVMIAGAWRVVTQRKPKTGITIYNCTNVESNRFTWGQLSDYVTASAQILPLDSPARIPAYGSSVAPGRFKNRMIWIFSHWIPAYVMDAILTVVFQKRRFVKWYTKIHTMCNSLSFFTMRSWTWDTSNVKGLLHQMRRKDREVFFFDTSRLDWRQHIMDYHTGVKKFILKEKMEDVPSTKKWIGYRQSLSAILKFIFFLLIFYLLDNYECASRKHLAITLLLIAVYMTALYLIPEPTVGKEKA